MSLPKFIKNLRNKVSKDNPSGETMEGSLWFNGGLSNFNSYQYEDGTTYTEITSKEKDNNKRTVLQLNSSPDESNNQPLRILFADENGNIKEVSNIYGTHYKPTPEDIGAFPNNNIVHNVDYNNYCITSGFYNLFGNCPNNPYGSGNTNTHFYLEVHVNSSNLWVRQTAYDVRTNRVFQRSLLDGVWSGWAENIVVNDVVGNYGDGWILINKWYDTNFGNHNVGFASGQVNGDVSKISINDFGMWWQKFTQSTNTWETYKLYHWGNIQRGSGTPPSTLEENGIYIKY